VDVDERRGRRDRRRTVVGGRDAAEGPVVVDGGQDEADLVLQVLVVGERRPRPRLLRTERGYRASEC
jgi:hypothetical protein